MNKKTLLATMSLAVLAACSTDDFQSQANMAEETGSVQFEIINGNDDVTRASWSDANKAVSFSAADGDLFTLYHGATDASPWLTGYENATYKAAGSPATLSTPSMIKQGTAIMVWPVDTAFNIKPTDNLAISIPEVQTDYVNQVPYVSDLINIGAYAPYTETPAPGSAYNTAGKDRKYPIFMRQMGSLLTLKADYAGTDATINALTTGTDPIDPIAVTEVKLETAAGTEFTKKIPVQFAAANPVWATPVAPAYNAWYKVTEFDKAGIVPAGQTTTLSAKENSLLPNNGGAKIIMLPQAAISETTPTATAPTGVINAAVTVNTIYGKVVIAQTGVAGSQYTAGEWEDAWIRYLQPATAANPYETKAAAAEASGDNAGKHKTTSNVAAGLMQTINWFGDLTNRTSTNPVVNGEQVGGLLTRYVKVILNHLDMSDLHIKNDKHLYDAVRVWKEMGLASATVYLDGDANGKFEISQNTIAKIHEINAAAAEEATPRSFFVKPCDAAGEACDKIVITGGGNIPDLSFIKVGDTPNTADVVLKAGESWSWSKKTVAKKKAVIVDVPATTGVASIINEGTLTCDATATLAIYDNAATPVQVTTIPFVNAKGANWNLTSGDTNVQFSVTNYGTVTISKGAEYHQDGKAGDTEFNNEALTLPKLITGKAETIGTVWNYGVFATVTAGANTADINNFGLIEHADKEAKTYITRNQTLKAPDGPYAANANYTKIFKATAGSENKFGRINLPFSNKDEDNVSISAGTAASGFVSITISTTSGAPDNGKLDLTSVGYYVNYAVIESGVTAIAKVDNQIKYLMFNSGDTEISWDLGGKPGALKSATYEGLTVLSPVNIKLWTTITVNQATYIKDKMYVGGKFVNGGWSGYYGNTTTNAETMYITY